MHLKDKSSKELGFIAIFNHFPKFCILLQRGTLYKDVILVYRPLERHDENIPVVTVF